MGYYFTAGELAKAQDISKQTLLFYDKIGLFSPAYVDPGNGYRYYSNEQLAELDTIVLLKDIGLSLDEIKKEMGNYNTETASETLRRSSEKIDRQIAALKSKKKQLQFRMALIEEARAHSDGEIIHKTDGPFIIYTHPVRPPYDLDEANLASKLCVSKAFRESIRINYQLGAIVTKENILGGDPTETSEVFITLDTPVPGSVKLPKGDTVSIYHKGEYTRTPESYSKLVSYCRERGLEIISPSYEFCLNDYLTTLNEKEFVTRLMVYTDGGDPSGNAV